MKDGYAAASPTARRGAIAAIAVLAASAVALAWMLHKEPALDRSSPWLLPVLLPGFAAYCAVGLYCAWVGVAAIGARRFPAASAPLPVATRIRFGAAGVAFGSLMLMAGIGTGYLAWLLARLALPH